jgi:hypothetical protein
MTTIKLVCSEDFSPSIIRTKVLTTKLFYDGNRSDMIYSNRHIGREHKQGINITRDRDTALPIGVNLTSNPFRDYCLTIKARSPLTPLKKAGRFHSPKNEDFGRGSAPVPTPPTDEKSVISEIGAGTGAPPLQENETALP